MGKTVYQLAREFKRKYPFTISWRVKSHATIIEKHLNPDEKVSYVFASQKGESNLDIINTNIVAITNKRLLIAQKRLIFGYFLTSITPDMFNDFKVNMGLIWGNVHIDTVKELVILSNIQKEALPEIETKVTEHMMKERKKITKVEKVTEK